MNTEKIEPVPILVLGERRRRALADRITQCVDLWLRKWGTSAGGPSTTVNLTEWSRSALESTPAETRNVEGSVHGVVHLAIMASPGAFAGVLNLPRGATASCSTGVIAATVCEETLTDLGYALVTNLPIGPWQMTSVETSAVRESMPDRFTRGWIASIELGDRGERLLLLLSPTLTAHLQPQDVKGAVAAVSRRRAAITEESICLQAILGEALVSIGDLASLAIDDVIVLREDISQPGYLVTSTGRRVGNFSLGRAGGKRAALIAK
jgi:hypothetical protein